MNWPMLFACFMGDVRKHLFSKRRKFFDLLTERIHKRVGFAVAWPDAMLFIQPEDWKECAIEAGLSLSEDSF